MGTILRIFFALVGLVILAIAGYAIYIATLLGCITFPWMEELPEIEAAVVDTSERDRIVDLFDEDIADDGSFDITLTEGEVNRVIAAEIAGVPQISRLSLELHPGNLKLDGGLRGRTDVPFSGELDVSVSGGQVTFSVTAISLGVVTVPGVATDSISDFVNDVVNFNDALSNSEVNISLLEVSEGSVHVVGIGVVSVPTEEEIVEVEAQQVDLPEPRASSTGQPTVIPVDGAWSYLALGDSLSVGEGSSGVDSNYAIGFANYLNASFGVTFGFQNFGISGESTDSMLNGGNRQLDRAIERVTELVNDGNSDTNVHVITIAMGANDIFPVLQGVECSADPSSAVCETALDAAVVVFGVNIEQIFGRLRAAAGPDTHIIVMTYYNPLNFVTGLVFEDVFDATINDLNTQIRAAAGPHNITIAQANDLFRGLSAALTHILAGDIHPNDDGYRVLLRAFQDAYEGVGPF